MSAQTDPHLSLKRSLQLQTVDSTSSSVSIGSSAPVQLPDSPASLTNKKQKLQQQPLQVQNLNNHPTYSNVVYPTATSLSMGAPRNLSTPSSHPTLLHQRTSSSSALTQTNHNNPVPPPNVVVATATQEPKRVRVYLSDQFHQLANLLGIDSKERSDVLSSAVEKLAHFQLQQEQRLDSTNLIHGFPSLFSCVNIENIPTCYLTLAGKFCDANKAFLQTFHFPLHSTTTISKTKQQKHAHNNNQNASANHVSPPTPNSVLSATVTSPAQSGFAAAGTSSSTSTASVSTTPPSTTTPLNSLQSQYDFNVLRRHSFASLVTPTDGPKLTRILSSLLNDQMSAVAPSSVPSTPSRSSSNHSFTPPSSSQLQQHTIDSQSLCLSDLNQGGSQRYNCVFNALKTRGVLKLLMVMCIPERSNSQSAELSPTPQGISPGSFVITPYSSLLSDTKILPGNVSVTPAPTPASAPVSEFAPPYHRTQSAPTAYHPYVTSVVSPANLTPTKLGPAPTMYQPQVPPPPPPPPQSAPVPLMSMNAWSPHSNTTVFDYSQQPPQQPQQPPQPTEPPKMQPVPQPVYSTYPTPAGAPPMGFQPPPQHPLSNVVPTFANTTTTMPPAYGNGAHSTPPTLNYSPVTSTSLPFASASPSSRTSPSPAASNVSQAQLDDIHHQLAIIQQQQAMLMASSQQLQHQQQQHQLQRQQLEQHIQLQQHQLHQQQQAHQQVVQHVQVVRPVASHLASLAYAAHMPPPPTSNVAVKIEPLHPPSPTVSTPTTPSED